MKLPKKQPIVKRPQMKKIKPRCVFHEFERRSYVLRFSSTNERAFFPHRENLPIPLALKVRALAVGDAHHVKVGNVPAVIERVR